MAQSLENRLVVAISSRALFDLEESHRIFTEQGLEAYSRYQIQHEDVVLEPGVAFGLVQKLLRLNDGEKKRVEVILLSHNSADTGLRVFNSIQRHRLDIQLAAFTNGASPWRYIEPFSADLFLSAEAADVVKALDAGYAAAAIVPSQVTARKDQELRIAFDGDAVLFSDEAERVFQEQGLAAFAASEKAQAREPLSGGPFKNFLAALHRIQSEYPVEQAPIRTALVTARSAPAHERVIRTLRAWNIRIDEALFLGGLPKGEFLKTFGADIFFDDQKGHVEAAADYVATGHVPMASATGSDSRASMHNAEFESWHEEKQSAYLYRVLAGCEKAPERKSLFLKLADAADSQALHWQKIAAQKQVSLPAFTPAMRARVVAHMLRHLGPERMLPVLAAMKVRGLSVYTHGAPSGHGAPAPGQPEIRHRSMSGNGSFRAAVFGINDGLVSNASLIMGMAGASLGSSTIQLAGVAGLLAGAASMAAGEYVSMRSQREMFEYQIGLEQQELNAYPEEEAEELALIYEARGIPAADAKRLSEFVISDPTKALDTLAREELGLNPDNLGSAWGAAGASFLSFALGALIPLLPYLWPGVSQGLPIAIGLTLAALFATGATVSLFTGHSLWKSGLRMLLIGACAGGATYLVGHLFGVAVS